MHPRILAIDLRSQVFGFAIFEGPKTLLGFGRKLLRLASIHHNSVAVRRKIARLTTFFAPSLIVLKHTSGRNDQELLKRKDAVTVIRQEAELRSVELVLLNRKDIYRAFRQSGATSKYKIAGLIAEMFPEVAWKLPPSRKNWEPEHHNMAIFDAISVGLTYFIQSGQTLDAPENNFHR
jgi:hypothetical protein